jgi:hypothetical protein
MSDKIRLREWSRFAFRDPEELIRRFNALEKIVADSSIPDRLKALRTNELKTIRETRQAALFALGLRRWAGNASVEVAASEDSDYDAVFRRLDDELMSYTPVQLKEVVPERWNKAASIDSILKKLVVLQSSRELVVGIQHTRAINDGKLELSVPKDLNVAGLFVFGSVSNDRSEWMIAGDFTKDEVSIVHYTVPTN